MREAFNAAVEFGDNLIPPWLLLIGKIGCGKTHLAHAAGQRLIEKKFKVRFWLVADLLDAIRDTYSQPSAVTSDIMEAMAYAPDVLILDDLGVEKQTDWVQEKLFQILDRRYSEGRPLLMTSNKDLSEISPRLSSRFRDRSICKIVVCEGEDYRPKLRALKKGRERHPASVT